MDVEHSSALDLCTRELIDRQLKHSWLVESESAKAAIEHYIVKWSIENMGSLLGVELSEFISSPSFCSQSSRTEWSLGVYPCFSIYNHKIVVLRLQRLQDQGPENVSITYRFGVAYANNELKWFEQEKKPMFEKGKTGLFQLEILDPDAIGVFSVACEMYVSYYAPQCIDNKLTVADYDLLNLSDDLVKLMRSKETCDYCIKLGNYEVIVHKAILGARSRFFNEVLKDERYCERYELPSTSLSSFTNLLLFMYSGDFNRVSKTGLLDIGFYECAVDFSVEDLAAYLSPNQVSLRSKLQDDEIYVTWRIENFSEHLASAVTCFRSPPIKGAHERSPEWTLILHSRKGEDSLINLDIYIESSADINVLHSVLCISLTDDGGNLRFTRSSTQQYRRDAQYGFQDFIKGVSSDQLTSGFLAGDCLKVRCRWKFVLLLKQSEEHVQVQRTDPWSLSSFSRLSWDLRALFSSGDFSDVSIKANELILRGHKSILSSRSKQLASQFVSFGNSRSGIIDMSDVDPFVVLLMIEHSYSGVMAEASPEVQAIFMSASEKYGFTSLYLMCMQSLGRQIRVGNFFDILAKARRVNNVNLVGKCLDVASANVEAVLANSEWENWKSREQQAYNLLVLNLPIFANRF